VRRTFTADGRFQVELVAPADRRWASLATPRGRIRCLDYRIVVSSTVRESVAQRAGVGA
jgi:hypothetical protein